MADYDGLDDAGLQELLSKASSYDERSAIRQVIRKRKKERGQNTSKGDDKNRSSYNRFAGSAATKSSGSGNRFELPVSARSQDSGPPTLKAVPKEEKTTPRSRKWRSPSPPAVQPSSEPAQLSPGPVESVPDELDFEPTSPTSPPPSSPPPSSPEVAESPDQQHESDGLPVTEEPAEDEPTADLDQDVGVAQEDVGVDSQEPDEVVEVEESQATPEQPEVVNLPAEEADGPQDLHHYLVAYVNTELKLDPPLPSRGKALYDTCSDATVLCNLINKSVPGTVDLRALSKVRGNSGQRKEAIEDNMTLVVESGRAIGCPITDNTAHKIIDKDPTTITNFLVDLVRARVVHLPGMEDEPSSTFSDWTYLFNKLNISVGSGSSQEVNSKKEDNQSLDRSWRDTSDSSTLTYEQRAAKRKAEREQRLREKDAQTSSEGLTYEERAQQRKAERERRRREREALAK